LQEKKGVGFLLDEEEYSFVSPSRKVVKEKMTKITRTIKPEHSLETTPSNPLRSSAEVSGYYLLIPVDMIVRV
jgi:hypothetical protein